MLKIDFQDFYPLDMDALEGKVLEIHDHMEAMKNRSDAYLGWIDYTENHGEDIRLAKEYGESFRRYETLVVVGIGGSFLGAKSFYDLLKGRGAKSGCELLFLGNNLSGQALKETLEALKAKDFAVNVISKSGGTLEPAIAFRLVLDLLKKKYGPDAAKRLMVTTDPDGGNLRKLAIEQGYPTLSIPGNVGGRYSVFTPVGIFPLAAAGIDTDQILEGVKIGKKDFDRRSIDNPAYRYGVARQVAAMRGLGVEIYTAYDPSVAYYAEWLKQLYGESEGKDGKGLYPMSVINTRDLHSLGQFIQEGTQNHFETILWFQEDQGITFDPLEGDFDGLNGLSGKSVDLINRKAMEGTRQAHKNGGILNLLMEVEEISPKSIAYLSYFFMKACGMSCYLLGVDPFNQPGVEEYKKEVKKLLNSI